jgi:hypothetical protein
MNESLRILGEGNQCYVRALDMDLALAIAGNGRQNFTTCFEHFCDTRTQYFV